MSGRGRPTPSRAGQQSARLRAQAEAQARQRRRRRTLLAVAVTAVVVLLVGGGIGFQAWRAARTPAAATTPRADEAPVSIETGRPVVFGSARAPVTVTVWEDFHCPHCAEFEEAYGPTLTAAQNAGMIKLAVYPLAFIDAGSTAAGNAFACAAEAGFGQGYYDGLFANHTLQWNDEQLTSLAQQTNGSVPDGFRSCVTGRGHEPWLQSIGAVATQQNIGQTPTVYVGERLVDLTQTSPEQLKAIIEEVAR